MDKLHLIGIKGTGMSALAQVLHDLGNYVQGSDKSTIFYTQQSLEARKIPLLEFKKHNINETFTSVVASSAFGEEHEEIKECRRKQIPVIRYHQFLGELIKQYISIGISGTHGKT